MLPKLIILNGVQEGKSFPISQKITSIGRGLDCDLCLEDPTCSRIHFKIERRGPAFFIQDAGSYNGTIVNRRRVDAAQLFSGDKIKVGQASIQFDLTEIEQWLVKTQSVVPFRDPAGFDPEQDTDYDPTSEEVVSMDDGRRLSDSLPANASKDLKFVIDADHEVATRHSVREMFFELLGLTQDWLGAHQSAVFLTNRGKLDFSNVIVRSSKQAKEFTCRINRNLVNHVIDENRSILGEFTVDAGGENEIALMALAVPIMSLNQVYAIIYVDSFGVDERQLATWSEERLRILNSVANQAGLAIENREMFKTQISKERFAAVGELTSFISHRFNNILQVINGGSYLVDIGLESSNPDLITKGWDIVKRNQNRITRLTSNLLAYSRVFEPKCEPIEVIEIFNDALDSVSDTFEISRVKASHVGTEGCTVFVDKFFTTRIIENLLSVALAASIEVPEELIHCTTSADSEYASLSIEFQHLDDRFNLVGMLEGPVSKLKAEMGRLELMLSKSQIEAQGGTFSVVLGDDGVNHIRVRLPRNPAQHDEGTQGTC